MPTVCAKVPFKKGEDLRKLLTEAQLINKDLMIKHNERYLYIPLLSAPKDITDLKDNNPWLKDIELVKQDFKKYPERLNDYKSLISLPSELSSLLPTSYDLIGSIVLVKIPKELIQHSKMIGEAILKVHKNIKTVARDMGVQGDFRVREIEIIAGEENTETIHKEYGIKLKMDISKVYFSPRLSSEHRRISKLIKPGELVLDMFAGVGPFSLMIAKYSQAGAIYAIDVNKYAIEYLIKNIDLNKVSNIFPLEGDAKECIENVPAVDRIIMNLPMESNMYLPSAMTTLKNNGIIHYHIMLTEDDLNDHSTWLEAVLKDHRFKLVNSDIHNLGSYSPKVNHYCFDLNLKV